MDLPVPKSKKKKTLQMTYPAPYSQTWDPDILPVLMKKNMLGQPPRGPKSPKTKGASGSPRIWSQQFPDRPDPTLPHLKYGVFRNRRGPAPDSQSWEPGVLPLLMKKNMQGPPRSPKTKRAAGSPRTRSQQFPDRPDPTVPRLKYGVFRNRRGPPRSMLGKPERQPRMEKFSKDTLPKSMPAKQTHNKKRSGEPVIRVPREYPASSSSSALTLKKQLKKKGAGSAGDRGGRDGATALNAFGGALSKETLSDRHHRYHPVIVTHTINESYSRQLCFSNILHVDIKPKTIGTYHSPSFCPSPNYRIIPRKLTM